MAAFIATYFVSRATLRVTAGLPGLGQVLAAHLASIAIVALVVGFLKAYFTFFAFDQTFVLILPQLFWLVLDLVRGKAARA